MQDNMKMEKKNKNVFVSLDEPGVFAEKEPKQCCELMTS